MQHHVADALMILMFSKDNEMILSHVGDSRAVLCRQGQAVGCQASLPSCHHLMLFLHLAWTGCLDGGPQACAFLVSSESFKEVSVFVAAA